MDSIGDIVWAINPARDNVPDLIQRMHRFAADLLSGRNIALEFHAEALDEPAHVGPELRRQVYLIYRECIRNAVRHARCDRVDIRVSRENGELLLHVADNGAGFCRSAVREGTGLSSLEERAWVLGGHIEWVNGSGTTVILRVPLRV